MAKPTLLIVDDEPEILNTLSAILNEDFNIMTANNGLDGLSIIKSNPLSLILLDLQMPEMNGVELIESVRNANNEIPILVITGNSSHEWAIECADLSVQGYVKKPVDVEKLTCRIKKLLGMEDYQLLQKEWGHDYHAKKSSLSPVVERALKHIHHNYHQRLDREGIGTHLNICPDYLSRKFHSDCGMHLVDYVNRYRVNKSREHLRNGNLSISDIASTVGIPDVSYFCKLFKKYNGVTPEEFRNNPHIFKS